MNGPNSGGLAGCAAWHTSQLSAWTAVASWGKVCSEPGWTTGHAEREFWKTVATQILTIELVLNFSQSRLCFRKQTSRFMKLYHVMLLAISTVYHTVLLKVDNHQSLETYTTLYNHGKTAVFLPRSSLLIYKESRTDEVFPSIRSRLREMTRLTYSSKDTQHHLTSWV